MKRENDVKWYPIEIEKDTFNIKGRTNGEVTFIDIELKECTLHGIRLVNGKSGTFLAPPSYKKGEKWYHYFYITKELSDAVLKALKDFDKTLVTKALKEFDNTLVKEGEK